MVGAFEAAAEEREQRRERVETLFDHLVGRQEDLRSWELGVVESLEEQWDEGTGSLTGIQIDLLEEIVARVDPFYRPYIGIDWDRLR